MEQVRAIAAHEIPTRPAFRMRRGDRVRVGGRDTDWPAFVFVTAANGSGWVPARHLAIDGDRALALADYDTQELPTSVGQVLEVLDRDDESGWLWCQATDGRQGWVPVRTLEEIRQQKREI